MNAAWTNDVLIANPKISDGDEWGDFRGGREEEEGEWAKLPARRRKTGDGNSRDGKAVVVPEGLRIEAIPRKIISADDTEGFEVVDWARPVLRLEPEGATQVKVERVVKFQIMPTCSWEEHLERLIERQVSSEWGRSKVVSIKWMVIASAGILMLLLVGMVLLPWVNVPSKLRQSFSLVAVSEETPEEVAGQNEMIGRFAEAEQLFLHFATAATVDDILPMVRDSATLEQTIRKFPAFPKIAKTWRSHDPFIWNVYTEGKRTCGVLSGLLPDFKPFSACMVMVDGRLLLDWKGTMGYGTADFSELEKGRGDGTEIRGSLKSSNFYTSAFPEETYRSYVFLAPDQARSIWVYSRRGELAEALLARSFADGEIMMSDEKAERFTLRLSRVDIEGGMPNQWVIKEMLHKDWISP